MQPKIVHVDYGLANHFGDRIEINKELKKSPDLYNYVLAHELEHTGASVSFEDLKNDLRIDKSPKMALRLFFWVMKRPRVWYEFLPIQRRENCWVVDTPMLILYGICGVLTAALIWIISRILA